VAGLGSETVVMAAKLVAGISLSIGPDATKKQVLGPVANWLLAVSSAYTRGFSPGSNPLGLGGGADAPVDRQEPALPAHFRSRLRALYPPEAIHVVYATLWALVPTTESAVRVGEWRASLRQAVRHYSVFEALLAKEFSWSGPYVAAARTAARAQAGVCDALMHSWSRVCRTPNSPPPLPLGITAAAAAISSLATAPSATQTMFDRWAAPPPPLSVSEATAAVGVGDGGGDREREVATVVLKDGAIRWPLVGSSACSWKAHQGGPVKVLTAHPLERCSLAFPPCPFFSTLLPWRFTWRRHLPASIS
jgi:hypothetical protein